MLLAQPPGDLLGRPLLLQPGPHRPGQPPVALELERFGSPPGLLPPGLREPRVVLLAPAVAFHLPLDRRRRPAQRLSYLPIRLLVTESPLDLRALLVRQSPPRHPHH